MFKLMKKLLGIMVLGLLLSGNAYADVNEPGVTSISGCDSAYNLIQYGVKGIDAYDICKVEKRKSKKWFDAECNDRPLLRLIFQS